MKDEMTIGAGDVGVLKIDGAPATPKRTGKTAFMVRHQAAGILTSHVFLSKPTEAQLAAMQADCVRLHGTAHPKTGEPHWTTVVEVPLLDGVEVPAFPHREGPGTKKNVAAAPGVVVSGQVSVVNPGEKA